MIPSSKMKGSSKKKKIIKGDFSDGTDDSTSVCTSAGEVVVTFEPEKMLSNKEKKKKCVSSILETNKEGSVGLEDLKAVTNGLMNLVLKDGVSSDFAKEVLGYSSKYEALLMKLMLENERLRGRLDVVGSDAAGVSTSVVPSAVVGASPVSQSLAVVAPSAVTKPVETWSVVVKGKDKGVTSEEVINKVEKEVGPTLGVRVHQLVPMRGGGAVIRTPSVAEREKVAKNAKFAEVGLEVSVRDKLGPKIIVQRVHSEILPDEFMTELYEMNFKEKMTHEVFKKSVQFVTGPWKAEGSTVNVVLGGSPAAMQHLLNVGRCYIKWYSFVVRSYDAISCCYRCLSFDHMIRNCRMVESTCRLCGSMGHLSSSCKNPICCRNCAFKRWPSDHLMMSEACPIYSTLVAKAKARH